MKKQNFLRRKLYDASQIDWEHMMFSPGNLKKLLIPLIVEQLLTSFMGMADTMMVSRVGDTAISAVSLTDSINVLVIQIFTALAAGGAILCSQYIGHGSREKSNEAARQLVFSVFWISSLTALCCLIWRKPLLHLVFGTVEEAVMQQAVQYFTLTAISFPFIALFESGAAFYRAGGNSRFPMQISVFCNILNIIGNAIFIFVFHWGVTGAALSTLLSRILCAVIIFACLRRPGQAIVLRNYLVRPNWKLIGKLLAIGVPSGIENGMFQFGKLAIQSSVSTLGTTAIAANAIMIILENLNGIAGIGIGIGLMTVVGQAVGAGRIEEAKYYICKLCKYSELCIIVSCVLTLIFTRQAAMIAGLNAEGTVLLMQMSLFVSCAKPFFWVLSFVPAYGFRAAGDVRFSMITSTLSMWLCRVMLSTVLIRAFGFGPIAVWIGMASDWGIRAVVFSWRYFSGRWSRFEIM